MTNNPYTPGQVPRVFAGRAVELRRIEDRLARVVDLRRARRTAPRLPRTARPRQDLASARRPAPREAAGLRVGVGRLLRDRPVLPELVRECQSGPRERPTRCPGGARPEPVAQRLESASPSRSACPGAKVQAAVAAAARSNRPRGSDRALEDAVPRHGDPGRDAAAAPGSCCSWTSSTRRPPTTCRCFSTRSRTSTATRETNPFAVVTAGLPVTPEALTRAATFGERSSFVSLDVLNDEDARTAAGGDRPPARSVSPGRRTRSTRSISRGARLPLPAAADRQHARGSRRGPDRGAPTDRSPQMRRAPGGARPAHLDAPRAMGRGHRPPSARSSPRWPRPATTTSPEPRSPRGWAATVRAISVPRERLIEKGVIEPVGHGLVRFTLPGFGDFVRNLDEE